MKYLALIVLVAVSFVGVRHSTDTHATPNLCGGPIKPASCHRTDTYHIG